MPSNLPIDGETVSVDFLELAEAGFDALDLGGERLSERNGAVHSEARPHDGLAERAAVSLTPKQLRLNPAALHGSVPQKVA